MGVRAFRRATGRLVLVALVASLFAIPVPARALGGVNVRAEADWILSLQIETGPQRGLIALNFPRELCVPYFSNIGASGLAAASWHTGDPKYVDAAWLWLSWYAAHMDASGFVTDYEYRDPNPYDSVQEKQWVSTNDYDSTDSYAATFIIAVRDAFTASGDTAKLQALWPAVRKATTAIQATAAPDFLTYAKPGYSLKYLMDNAEVLDGWRAALELAEGPGNDATLASVAQQWVDAMPAALESFWNPSRQAYDVAISNVGGRDQVDFNELYPSVTAQAWMIDTGLVPLARAQALVDRIDATHPQWDDPLQQDWFDTEQGTQMQTVKWWPEMADAFARAGRTIRASEAIDNMMAVAISNNRMWPYHVANAGRMVWLAASAPNTTFSAMPPAVSNLRNATFEFNGSSGATGFECSLDGVGFTECTSPFTATNLLEGPHTFAVRARDGFGRVDATPAIRSWRVDVTPPAIAISSAPPDPSRGTAVFGFGASDTVTPYPSLDCAMNGGVFAPCASPATFALATGRHTFSVRARDEAGNTATATRTWNVDADAPETWIVSGPPAFVDDEIVEIAFAGSDAQPGEIGFECRLGAAPFTACASPMRYPTHQEGTFTMEVRAYDAVGNVDPTPDRRRWTVDHSLPTTSIVAGPPTFARDRGALFRFTGTNGSSNQPASAYECSLDGAAFTRCVEPVRYDGLAEGAHTFDVRAVDAAGNVDPTPARHEWSIDTAAPHVFVETRDGAIMSTIAGESTVVRGSASDADSGIDKVQVTFTPSPGTTAPVVVLATLSCDQSRRSCVWTAQPPKASGRYRVHATPFDRAANNGATATPISVVVLPR